MNKKRVDSWILTAYKVIASKIANEDKKVDSGFRGQIAAFGSAVQMGSLISAVSFFSKQGSAKTDRSKLMDAIKELVSPESETLFEYIKNNANTKREEIIDAAISIKLALNLFELV